MKLLNTLAGSMIAVSLLAAPAASAAEPVAKHDMRAMKYDVAAFMKSCDMDHDGMISRAEMHAHVDKMFDRMDTKKAGKLDDKQTEAFLKEFTKLSGG